MAEAITTTARLRGLVDRLHAGDREACDLLLEHAGERLRHLVRKQLGKSPAVHRWEETGDVLQTVLLRLRRALESVAVRDVRHFFSLASVQIRRELVDLWRHYYGPEGAGKHHATAAPVSEKSSAPGMTANAPDPRAVDPCIMLALHEAVERMTGELQEVVNLLYYQGLSHTDAAECLNVSTKTIGRRWREARVALGRALDV